MSTETEKEVKNSETSEKVDADTVKKEKPEKEKKSFNKRKFKYGTIATTITVAFTAIIVLLNILFSALTDRYGLKLDTTKEKIFEVSSQTTDYLKSLNKDVEIAVMANENELENSNTYTKMVREVIEKYAVSSDRIKVNYYDIEKHPEKVKEYSKYTSEDIHQGSIVITCQNRIKQISLDDLFVYEYNQMYQQQITGFKAEEVLTSAILYVSNENPSSVALLTVQQSESVKASLSMLKESFENNGYTVSEVDPLSEDISADFDIVVLPAPSTDLIDSVITKLDNYLYNDGKLGKNLLYFANYDQRDMPKVDAFLEEWGIKIGNEVVEETQTSKMAQVGVQGMNNYVNVPIVSTGDDFSDYANKDIPMVMPAARPVTLLFDENNDRSTSVILKSSSSASLYDLTTGALNDITDEYTVMACGSKHIYNDSEKVSSNVIVSGSAFFMDSVVVQTNGLNNQEFFMKMLGGFTGKSVNITVNHKSLSTELLTVKSSVISGVNTFVVLIIPILVAVAGIIVAVRRSKK